MIDADKGSGVGWEDKSGEDTAPKSDWLLSFSLSCSKLDMLVVRDPTMRGAGKGALETTRSERRSSSE